MPAKAPRWERKFDPVKLGHANTPFEGAADRCGIAYFDGAPLCAHQQQNVAKAKADVRNLVGIIGGDKAKTQTYCQILELGRQLNQAVGDKDRKKIKALSRDIERLELPEFVSLTNIVKGIDLNSPDGREIALIIQSLNQSCPD